MLIIILCFMQNHFAKLVDELERGMASLLETYRTGAPGVALGVLWHRQSG
jgi:hypothetical protein